MQSLVAPELTPALSRSTEVSLSTWRTPTNDRVAFRIAVNPIVRTTRQYTDDAKTEPTDWSNTPGNAAQIPRREDGTRDRSRTRQTARVVPLADVEAWLCTKIGPALSQVEVLNHFRDTSVSGRHKVVVDTFDALATVVDADALDRLRLEGVGRSKTYGCGLLTVARLG